MYSAKDIIVVKSDKMVVDAVDLTKGGFRDHLNAAVDGAVKFATTFVTNDLSGAITYVIQLPSLSFENREILISNRLGGI